MPYDAHQVEAERRRIAHLLDSRVIDPLNLLLSQANVYERSLSGDGHVAVAVLANLARRVMQQVRDLSSDLHPTALENLGLEPALEVLAGQAMRAHGIQVRLDVARLPQRLPLPLELALYRLAQDVIERAVSVGRASCVTIRLADRAGAVQFELADNGIADAPLEALHPACARIEQLGGTTALALEGGALSLRVEAATPAPVALTPREIDVLRLLAEGMSNKAIADALTLSPRTINFHLDNIYAKLGVNSRAEAIVVALRQGWFPPPDDRPR